MYLIRFMMFLPDWKLCKKLHCLPLQCTNDIVSTDGDLSFFGVEKYFSDNICDKEIKDAIMRSVFSNYSKWRKPLGLLFIKHKELDKIKKCKLLNDLIPILTTRHFNMSKLTDRDSRKIKKLFYRRRFQSKTYTMQEIASFFHDYSDDDWAALLSLPIDPAQAASEIRKKFFRENPELCPEYLKNYKKK